MMPARERNFYLYAAGIAAWIIIWLTIGVLP
jgi:hypothetical protein